MRFTGTSIPPGTCTFAETVLPRALPPRTVILVGFILSSRLSVGLRLSLAKLQYNLVPSKFLSQTKSYPRAELVRSWRGQVEGFQLVLEADSLVRAVALRLAIWPNARSGLFTLRAKEKILRMEGEENNEHARPIGQTEVSKLRGMPLGDRLRLSRRRYSSARLAL